jgi:hypothetical protein
MIFVITPFKTKSLQPVSNMAMVREIVDGHWNIARHLVQNDDKLLYAIVQGGDNLTREEMMTPEALHRILQRDTWCYVIHRVPGGFEEVTYYMGVPKKVVKVAEKKIENKPVAEEESWP